MVFNIFNDFLECVYEFYVFFDRNQIWATHGGHLSTPQVPKTTNMPKTNTHIYTPIRALSQAKGMHKKRSGYIYIRSAYLEIFSMITTSQIENIQYDNTNSQFHQHTSLLQEEEANQNKQNPPPPSPATRGPPQPPPSFTTKAPEAVKGAGLGKERISGGRDLSGPDLP